MITGTTLSPGTTDDNGVGNLPIGFTFGYNGTNHTVFGMRTNGLIELSQTTVALSGFSANALATTANCIAPLWDDNNTVGGTMIYTTTGTAPNRVLIAQWTNLHVGGSGSTTNPTISMQVRLYETINKIEFIYGSTSAALLTTTASIGISGAVGNYLSVTPLSPVNTSTVSSASENNAINSAANFPSGTVYTFSPLAPSFSWAPSGDVVSPTSQNTATNALTATTTFTVTATNGGCSGHGHGHVTLSAGLRRAHHGRHGLRGLANSNGEPHRRRCTLHVFLDRGWQRLWWQHTDDHGIGGLPHVCMHGNGRLHNSCNSSLLVTTNALPVVTVSPTTGTYCTPGGPAVALGASGATTYAWSPAGGLDATTGANVNASPSATTTYTVTGTDANGCVNTATAVITVAPYPTGVSATATPTSVCANGTSTLTASAASGMSTYSFQATGGTFTPISGGTAVATSTSAADFLGDTKTSVSIPVGFPFMFNGVSYSNVVAMSDGYISFNAAAASSLTNNLATSATTQRPLIAPLWDDLDGASGSGAANYITTGAPGSRVFTIEWLNWQWNYLATGVTISFQVKLYEANNSIELIYRQESGTVNSASASIGIAGVATGSGNYLSLNGTGTAPTASSTTETTSLSTKPATGQTYRFTPQSLTYSWAPSGLVTSPNTASTPTTALTSSQTYTVTVTNSGCPATATTTVTVSPAITAASITGNLAFCTGGSTTLTATPTDGVAPFTYLWSPGGQTTASISVNAAGNYSCQVGDACSGSVNTGTVTVVENSLPTVTIPTVVPANGAICGGVGNVQMTATGATSYAWLPVTGLDNAAIANPTSTATVTTTYTVTGTDGNGCTNTATQLVNVGPDPVISSVTATPAAICVIGNSQLQANASVLNNSTSNGGAVTIPLVGNASPFPSTVAVSGLPATGVVVKRVLINGFSHTWPSDADLLLQSPTGTSVIIMADAGNTTDAVNQNYVFQDGSPLMVTSGLNPSGTYAPSSLDATADVFTPGPGSINQAAPTLATFSGDPNGTWNLYVVDDASGDGGSITSWSIVFEYNIAPTYSWSPATFLNFTNISNPEAQNINATTTYTVTATSAIGCTAQGNTTVTVNPLPTVTCPGNSSVCIDAAAFALTGGSPAGGTYSGTGVSAGNFNPATAGAGTHTITYSYTDGNSCTNTCTFDITVNALPVMTCPGNSSVCIDATAFALTGGSPVGGTYSGAGVSAGNFDPATAGAGTHTITYSYTDGNTCTNTCTFDITVNALPVITCPGNSSVCIDAAAFTLTGGSPVGGTYSGAGVSAGNFNPATAGAGTHTITYSYTDGNGCTNTPCTFDITVNALPVMTCPGNSSVCIDAAAFALTGGSPVGGTYSGAGVSAGNFNPATAGAGTHTITYSYTDGNSCTNTCTFDITVNALPVVTCPADQVVAANAPAFTLTGGAPAGGTYSGPGVSGGQFDATVAGAGNHLITYSYTDGNGCSNTCTFTISVGNMVLVLETDASADVVTWEVRTTPGNVLAASGNGPYAASTTYTLPFYLANGDYVLSVFDSGGDGLCCMNGTGGFILRTSGGARFIDANNSGIFTSTASVTLGFTLPMGANFNQLTASRCDRENYLPSDFIQCGEDPAVTAQYGVTNSTSGYQFWIFDPNGGYSRRVLIDACHGQHHVPGGPGARELPAPEPVDDQPDPVRQGVERAHPFAGGRGVQQLRSGLPHQGGPVDELPHHAAAEQRGRSASLLRHHGRHAQRIAHVVCGGCCPVPTSTSSSS